MAELKLLKSVPAKATVTEELLSNAGPNRAICTLCSLGSAYDKPSVPVGWTGKLAVITEILPTSTERIRILRWAESASYQLLDLAFIPAVRCAPKTGAKVAMLHVRACRAFLLRSLNVLKPEVILAMGPTAARALTNQGAAQNVSEYRGKFQAVPGIDFNVAAFITYEPGTAEYLYPRVEEDFRRAVWPELARPINTVPLDGTISFDSEFAPDKTLLTIAAADSSRAIAAEVTEDIEPVLAVIRGAKYLAGHSVSGDVDQLVKLGLAKPGWISGEDLKDSLLFARMADENRTSYGLESLLMSGHNVRGWKHETVEISETDATLWPVDARRERCRLDSWASAVLANDFQHSAAGPKRFTHRVAQTLHRVQLAGVYVDSAALEATRRELGADREKWLDLVTKSALQTGMTGFSPTKDADIREFLYERLKLPVLKETKKGQSSVAKAVLKQLKKHSPAIQYLIDFNAADKRYTTNVLGLYDKLLRIDDRRYWLPVNINPLGARTGRRTSSEPNMQNWPGSLRQMVVSRWAGGLISDNDYSKLEPVLLGFLAGDDKLIDAFLNRGGYVFVAKEMLRRDVQPDTDDYRVIKEIFLGTNYNAIPQTIADTIHEKLGIMLAPRWEDHVQRVREFQKKYFAAFPGVPRYMRAREEELLRNQEVRSLTGRVRRLPLPDKADPKYKRKLKRLINQAINFPVQSLAADVTGSALIDVEAELLRTYNLSLEEYHLALLDKKWPEMSMIVNEVHDDLPADLHPVHAKRDAGLVVETMQAIPTLRKLVAFDLPLKVGQKVGTAWGLTDGGY